MSNLSDVLETIGNNLYNKTPFQGREFPPYHFMINGTDVNYDTNFSETRLDSDGDLLLDFNVGQEDLLSLCDEDTIVEFVKNLGYKVEEED